MTQRDTDRIEEVEEGSRSTLACLHILYSPDRSARDSWRVLDQEALILGRQEQWSSDGGGRKGPGED